MESIKKHPLDNIDGIQKFTVVGYRAQAPNGEESKDTITLTNPKVVVNY